MEIGSANRPNTERVVRMSANRYKTEARNIKRARFTDDVRSVLSPFSSIRPLFSVGPSCPILLSHSKEGIPSDFVASPCGAGRFISIDPGCNVDNALNKSCPEHCM